MAFFQTIRYCMVPDPSLLGDGICQNFDKYNTPGCNFDNGDCSEFNKLYSRNECKAPYPFLLNDTKCHGSEYNTPGCNFDEGDCEEFNQKYPECVVDTPLLVGNGVCDIEYNTSVCEWDGTDCLDFWGRHPDCIVDDPDWIGNGDCDGGGYNTKECGYDGGDCLYQNNIYPDCEIENVRRIDNSICDGELNTQVCNFDGEDCNDFNEQYPSCFGIRIQEIGDGTCQHNNEGCNYDDGDCELFNALYPDCKVDKPFLIGDGYCHNDYNTEECKADGGDCIDEEASVFVNGELVSIEAYKNDIRTFSIIQITSSIVSLISSVGIIWILYRSFKGMSVPYHRLLLGLSVADICSSSAQSFSTLPASDPFDIIWNARGTNASCQTQGFFLFLGSIGAPLYNCSLCFYYLAVITYKRGRDVDAYLRKTIEVYLHAVPIAVSLIGATTVLALNAFHPNMTYCFIGADPLCDDIDSCERSNANARILFVVFSAGPYLVLPCVIAFTMLGMYRAVRRSEKMFQQYGVQHLLRAGTNAAMGIDGPLSPPAQVPRNSGNDDGAERGSKMMNMMRLLSTRGKAFISSIKTLCVRRPASQTGRRRSPNNANRQSRAVLKQALAFALAFLATFLFPIIVSIRTLCGYESGPILSILARICFPLQGFFNFIVYIYPKVLCMKNNYNSEGGITWFGAFAKAIQSRGARIDPRSRGRGQVENTRNTQQNAGTDDLESRRPLNHRGNDTNIPPQANNELENAGGEEEISSRPLRSH